MDYETFEHVTADLPRFIDESTIRADFTERSVILGPAQFEDLHVASRLQTLREAP